MPPSWEVHSRGLLRDLRLFSQSRCQNLHTLKQQQSNEVPCNFTATLYILGSSIGKAKEEVERNDVSEDDVCWLWNEGFYPKQHLLYKSHWNKGHMKPQHSKSIFHFNVFLFFVIGGGQISQILQVLQLPWQVLLKVKIDFISLSFWKIN